ncbi:uncharacterized protein At2g39795, mitochondrial-like isoform X1 [Cucurbita moschata]|uniref:Uncharacterized protein At2g39795, mitochondrial-like isoform X1 n=1 Tax=Cucurbita moschata TaxID=3662 RepID=A0A6J1G7K0_CUCMO|nr:uncharacterized protein At2g39795, mitochondrial-like isoform X1 [Cucurbita moschata]
MALNSIFRRASSLVLPLAVRSIATPRSFHHAISAAITVGKRNLSQDLNRSFFLPSLRSYSAASESNKADVSLLNVLESEIQCAEEDDQNSQVDEIPEEFPFKIQDNPGERTISLSRKYEDEIIKVEVDMPNVAAEDEDEDNDEGGDNDEQTREESSIPLVVSISKESGECLEFGVTAFPDEISIDHLSIKKADGSEDQLAYEGPEFQDLDENLQKAFHKYLEIRGIKPSTTNFLHEYMVNKDSREYSMWLKNLKNFVEK